MKVEDSKGERVSKELILLHRQTCEATQRCEDEGRRSHRTLDGFSLKC